MSNYADDNTLYAYNRDFHQVQEYFKKDIKYQRTRSEHSGLSGLKQFLATN